jgi:hypothetical protein
MPSSKHRRLKLGGTYRAVIFGMFDAPRICALAISSFAAVVVAWVLAPDGYQDECGFHFLIP